MSRVPGTRRERPPVKVWVWPCGCVTRDSRTGPLVDDCGDERCYRRSRPATVRVAQVDAGKLDA